VYQFTPEGGSVEIEAKVFQKNKRYLLVSIADTGVGIPPERKDAIFEKFVDSESSSNGHTGLGLYVAKTLTTGLKGKIWVESSLGKGSTFSIILPIADN